AVRELRAIFEAADEVVAAAGGGGTLDVLRPEVRDALDRAETGAPLDARDVRVLEDALGRAADVAIGPAGGGLLEAATATRVGERGITVLGGEEARATRRRRNPVGKLAGLRISKKNYDRRRAYRFRKAFQRWMPHL